MKIGITMGDPKGIGPEIITKAWNKLSAEQKASIRIYGDYSVLEKAAELANVKFESKQIVTTSCIQPPIGSTSDPEAARITLAALDAAISDVKSGFIDAIVTAPVNKFRLQNALPEFIGHTEYLAQLTSADDVVMMFASNIPCNPDKKTTVHPLRVALATTHISIKDIPNRLSIDKVLGAIRKLDDALKRFFSCKYPRLGILGLNPHAGDKGALGSEEETIIIPAIEKARSEGFNCIGPLVVDSVFSKIKQLDFDGVVAMYHDQGLIPMKILYGLEAVNISLGLPFIRTSPAHGTAEDIAWRDLASPESMLAAITMAERMLEAKKESGTK